MSDQGNGDIFLKTEDHRAETVISPFLREHKNELGITDSQVPELAHEVAHRERMAEQLFPPNIMLEEVKEILEQHAAQAVQV